MAKIAGQTVTGLAKLTPPILKSVRRELGFWRFDLREFGKRTDGTAGMINSALDDLTDSVHKTFKRDDDNGDKPDGGKKH
jgi:hypothetical protein